LRFPRERDLNILARNISPSRFYIPHFSARKFRFALVDRFLAIKQRRIDVRDISPSLSPSLSPRFILDTYQSRDARVTRRVEINLSVDNSRFSALDPPRTKLAANLLSGTIGFPPMLSSSARHFPLRRRDATRDAV